MRTLVATCAVVLTLLFCLTPLEKLAAQSAAELPRLRTAGSETSEPDRAPKRLVRFLTSADYPPFQYVAPDGNPAGFNVDLARAICSELGFSCTIQALPWNDLLDALQNGRADALVAGMKPTEDLRGKADLTRPYFRAVARFTAPKASLLKDATPEALATKRIAVVAGTAHEAFLKAFFAKSDLRGFPDAELARAALKGGQVDAMFGDGAALSLWLGGSASEHCCAFVGSAYTESRYFGEGMVIATRKGDLRLRDQIDTALDNIETKGVLSDLYLRWFPIGIY